MISIEDFEIKSTLTATDRIPTGEDCDALYSLTIDVIPKGGAPDEKAEILTDCYGMYVKYKDNLYLVTHQVAFLRHISNVIPESIFLLDLPKFTIKR